jgi:hypothetical protein
VSASADDAAANHAQQQVRLNSPIAKLQATAPVVTCTDTAAGSKPTLSAHLVLCWRRQTRHTWLLLC